MSERQPNPAPSARRPDLEVGDLSVRGIGVFTVGIVAILLVAGVLMWFSSLFLRGLVEAKDPPPPALAEAQEPYDPPAPRLQADPAAELVELREREDLILATWGWVDKEGGVAQVPIERAMELLVESMETEP